MLSKIKNDVLNGVAVTREQVETVLLNADLTELTAAADEIRNRFCGNKVDLCSIINGKCGRCSEDCKFCVQSHNCKSELDAHDFVDYDTFINACKQAESAGVDRFSIVTSGRTLNKSDYEKAVELYSKANEECKNISLCASHGLLTREQLAGLKAVGVNRYHSNIETSERYFPYICSTHTFADKIRTIKDAQAVGMEVCSGGIFGIGETMADRLDMAFTLRDLGVTSIPINIYLPLEGTFFRDIPNPSYEEILRIIAIFRFVNPKANIRLAAGRRNMPEDGLGTFSAGANATITGDMLTTVGNGTNEDREMLVKNGFEVKNV
jgi:biotin synthase